ncbi:hypothetical protein ACFL6X_06460 [Candidatus Latescibacterota bacterium]
MKPNRFLAAVIAFLLACHPCVGPVSAEAFAVDTRVYLADGTVVMGQLLESGDLIIVRGKGGEIFTFEPAQISKIVTLESLGGNARMETVREFPYISFLGGAVAFSLISWLQFDKASDRDKQADLNAQFSETAARARDLRDEADSARLLGWSAGLVAAGCLGVALIPRERERRVFPELSLGGGRPTLRLVVRTDL